VRLIAIRKLATTLLAFPETCHLKDLKSEVTEGRDAVGSLAFTLGIVLKALPGVRRQGGALQGEALGADSRRT
jgi:hypothetical protein